MTAVTSSFLLVNSDPLNCPNGRQLQGGLGIQLSDEGPGGYLIVSADDFLLSLQNVNTNGFLVRNNTNSAVSRTLTSDGTIQITNPAGTNGNPILSIAPRSCVQNVIASAYGIDRATQGRLNFIGAGGVGVTVTSNGVLSSADITISGAGGAPQLAGYLVKAPYSGLTNAFAMSTLPSGILKNTTGTGIPSIAVSGTDYQAPSPNLTAIAGLSPALGSMIVGTGSAFVSRSIGAAGTVPLSNGSDWSWAAASFPNPMTTAGDTIVGGVNGAPTRVPAGANGQVYTMVAGVPAWSAAGGGGPNPDAVYVLCLPDSSMPHAQSLSTLNTGIMKVTTSTGAITTAVAGTDYVAPNANLTAVSGLSVTKGAVLVCDGTNINELAPGVDGYALVASSSSATGLAYAPFATNPMTTAGDTIVGGTNGLPTRLPIGTNGQVYTVVGGTAAWATNSGGPSANATYIVQTADASIPNAQALSVLATGLLKNTTATGVLSAAVAGTDYVAPNANLTAVSGLPVTKGSILVCDGTNINQIAVGSDGMALVASSASATGLTYASLATNPMTTVGDTVVGGAGGAPTRLPIGPDGQVITSVGGTAAWAPLPVSGVSSLSTPQYSGLSLSSSTGAITMNKRSILWQYGTTGATYYQNGSGNIGTYMFWKTANIVDPSASLISANPNNPPFEFIIPFTGTYKFILNALQGGGGQMKVWNATQDSSGSAQLNLNNNGQGPTLISQFTAGDVLILNAGPGGGTFTFNDTTLTIEYLGQYAKISPNGGSPFTPSSIFGFTTGVSVGTFTIPSDYVAGSNCVIQWNYQATFAAPVSGLINYSLSFYKNTIAGTLLSTQTYPFGVSSPQPSSYNSTQYNVTTYISSSFVPGDTINIYYICDSSSGIMTGCSITVPPFSYTN